MMSKTVFTLLCIAPATAVLRGTGQQSMRPEVVSELLSNVETKWIQGWTMVMKNVTDEATSYGEMEASCLKVSTAIVAGSEGDKDKVVEYMQDVCSSAPSKDSLNMCPEFANGVTAAMSDDESFNREQLDLKPFCKKFWDRNVAAAAQAEQQKLAVEEAKKALEEKKREEVEHEEEKQHQDELKKKRRQEAAAQAAQEEETAKEVAEAKQASLVVQQNTTRAQSTNATMAEAQSDTQPAAEVQSNTQPVADAPQTNATAPANASDSAAAAQTDNVNATQTEAAPAKVEAPVQSTNSTKK